MTSLFRTIKKKKRERTWEFPGSSVVRTPHTHHRGPRVESCCSSWGYKESDTTGCLDDNNNREIKSYNFAACPKKKQNNPRPINRKKNDKMVLKWNEISFINMKYGFQKMKGENSLWVGFSWLFIYFLFFLFIYKNSYIKSYIKTFNFIKLYIYKKTDFVKLITLKKNSSIS